MHDNSQHTCGLQCFNLPGYSSCEQNAAMHACCAAIFHGLEVDSVQCMTTANTHVACSDLFNAHVHSTYLGKDRPEYMP